MLGKDSTDGKSYLVESLQRDAGARARQHSAVEALIDDWAMCLSDTGWEFEDPSNPFHHFEGGDPAEEVEAALADIRCKQETGLLRVWVAADVAYQHRLVEENAQALRELSGWLEELRDNANRIIVGER